MTELTDVMFRSFFCLGQCDLLVTVTVSLSVLLLIAFFVFENCLKVEKYEYFMDNNALTQIITTPAQLIAAPAQPPAAGVTVYTALLQLNISRSCPYLDLLVYL